ncbi:MAG: metallophosphoesterase family protein [Verrucomicrobiaceae bacterium]
MKRRGFLGAVSGGTVAVSSRLGAQSDEGLELVMSPMVVMAPRDDGVEIVWAVGGLCRAWVEVKDEGGKIEKVSMDAHGLVPQGDEVVRVRLEGLRGGARYEVRGHTVSSDGKGAVVSEWRSFRTLDSGAAKSAFVVWNDTHQNEETLKRLHAGTPKADFLLWNGDLCNDWHKEGWLVPTLLSPAGQDVSEGRPLMVVWGNHDVRGKWAYRMPEMIATPNGRPFYAFRNGPVAVVCLHTGEDKPDDHPSFGGRVAFETLRKEQAEWLKEVTAQPEFRDAPYRVVFCHIPLRWKKERVIAREDYGNGNYDSYSKMSRDEWHEALVEWGAQVVISGHMHETAFLPGNGDFPYAQLVGGGPKPEQATWIEGAADEGALTLTVKNLDGKEVERVEFAPLRV